MLSRSWAAAGFALVATVCLSGDNSAKGIVVASMNANTTAPPGCPGFKNVGKFPLDWYGNEAGGTFVYLGMNSLGEHWCITAEHLFNDLGGVPPLVFLGGIYYGVDAASWVHKIGGYDIAVFKIIDHSEHQLSNFTNLRIASRTLPPAQHFYMVGSGWFEYATDTVNGDFGYWVEYDTVPPYPYIRWAENFNLATNGSIACELRDIFATGAPNLGQALTWDSGGAIFADGVNGALSGIINGGVKPDDLPTPDFLRPIDGTTYAEDLAPIRSVIIQLTGLGGVFGDTNDDGVVDVDDLDNVRNNLGSTDPGVLGDTDGNGTADEQDLLNVKTYFGNRDPP
jgi:hypothetical protein